MSVIGIIPARGGSKGFPGKNTYPLLGKPMIGYVVEAALQAETLDRVIVSTDSEEIAGAGRAHGAEVIMRPPEISGDTAPIEEALKHVVRTLEEQGEKIDAAVLMQANVPIRKPGMIDKCVRELFDSGKDSILSGYELNQRPEWAKVLVDGQPVPYMECKSYRRQELPTLYLFDGAVEVIRRDILMAAAGSGVHTFYGTNVGFAEQERLYAFDLDSRDDIPLIEAMLSYMREKSL